MIMQKQFFTFVILFLPLLAFNQTSSSDCNGAIVLCGDLYTEESAPPGTGDVYEYTGVCNANVETMSLWYTFTVQQDGDLGFILTPNSPVDDYDWGLFDVTNGGCAGIVANGASPEVSCNSYGSLSVDNGPTGISTADGGTGNSNGPGDLNGPQFNADLPVTTGQTFALVVMNWSNSTDGYTIDFSGSTATIYDDVNPTLLDASSNCGNSEFHIVFSEVIINTTAENLDFQISGPGGSFVFTDVTADNPLDLMDSGFTLGLDASIITPGLYTLVVTNESGFVADACGNLAIDASVTIELFAPLTYELIVETACNGQGGSIQLDDISGGTAPYEFLLNGNLQDDFTSDNLNDGNYTVSISDQNDCVITLQAIVPDNPIAVVIPEQDTLSCARTLVDISGVLVSPEQNVSYSWYYFADGTYNPTGSTSITTSAGSAGVYQLVVVNSDNGCSAEANVTIASENIEAIDLTKMKFPNIITPNKDSKNEDWAPFIDGDENYNLASAFETYDLRIYNRWGNLVFNSESSNSGRWSARDDAPGVYYFLLYYRLTCGGVQEGTRQGTIQVLK